MGFKGLCWAFLVITSQLYGELWYRKIPKISAGAYIFQRPFYASTSPQGAYIWRGDLTEDFLRYPFGGLIFGGAYTWRGFFRNFTVLHYKVDEWIYLYFSHLGPGTHHQAGRHVSASRSISITCSLLLPLFFTPTIF